MTYKEKIQTFEKIDKKIEAKSNGQAKTAILQFLKDLSIDRIIYVDDRCSIQELKEEFIGKLIALYPSKPKSLNFVNWGSPFPVFELEISETWDKAEEDGQKQLFLSVLKFENIKEELDNSFAPLKLKEHLKEKIDLFSPSAWVSKKDEIIAGLTIDSKILFLFDIEFNLAPLPDGRDGKDLAVELLSIHTIKDFVYCGIFSHLFDVEQETEKRNKYCKTHNLEKERFYTISKKRFQDDSYLPGLAEGIKNTLLINEVEFLKSESSKILKKSFKDSLKEIEELKPDSFNHLIQKSSIEEGIWEMATLIRVNNVITNDKALNALLSRQKRAKINDNLAKIRNFEKIKTGTKTPFDRSQIQVIREKELFLNDNVLNQLHFPISNGDIFFVNKKEYILLGQPCNLALRKNGRRNRKYDIGFFVELECISKEKFEKYSKEQLATIELIVNADISSEQFKIIKFSTFKTVSLLPLDLTVYNTDGIASIDLNKSKHESLTIQEPWKKRYRELHKQFTFYKNSISVFKSLKSLSKDSLKDLVYYGKMFKGYEINNENILNYHGNKISLDIKRISHYRAPYSNAVLQSFMRYLSRNAFDHDFLKE